MTLIQNLSCNVKQNVSRHLYHIMLYRVHFTWSGFELTMLVLIGTDCKVIINPTTIRTQPRRLQNKFTNISVGFSFQVCPFLSLFGLCMYIHINLCIFIFCHSQCRPHFRYKRGYTVKITFSAKLAHYKKRIKIRKQKIQ